MLVNIFLINVYFQLFLTFLLCDCSPPRTPKRVNDYTCRCGGTNFHWMALQLRTSNTCGEERRSQRTESGALCYCESVRERESLYVMHMSVCGVWSCVLSCVHCASKLSCIRASTSLCIIYSAPPHHTNNPDLLFFWTPGAYHTHTCTYHHVYLYKYYINTSLAHQDTHQIA